MRLASSLREYSITWSSALLQAHCGTLKLSGTGAHSVSPVIVTAHVTAPPVAIYNVATRMSMPKEALGLLDRREQNMYSFDPLCFYANIRRKYAEAAYTATGSTLTQ